ncbi:hypothetical protein [Alloalcanivorax mobilis]|uniref:hypothetical protein n=1 Tax=Alloalcanivorax mobilis TaxID=2019569 RepID=UPI001E292E20|nr:hypothetical protein [Alloalcanivorax mobilis]
MEWITQHQKLLMLLTNAGTLLIWLVYAQLLYNGYRRQRRPRVLINRGKSQGPGALCLISNMSAESIFIQHIIAHLETDQGQYTLDVTELEQNYREGDEHGAGGLRDSTRQGPLGSGEFLHIGTFDEVIERIARGEGLRLKGNDARAAHDPAPVCLRALSIELLAVYGSEDPPIGVRRRFLIRDSDGERCLVPESWDSRRLTGWRTRRQLHRRMQAMVERSDQLS